MLTKTAQRLVFLSALAAISAWSATSAIAQDADCYDAEVSARIVSQTPTVMGHCDDCIIISWPWIIDLDVRRIHSGDVQRGRLTVLTVQHTDFRRDFGAHRWKLRRNDQGGFNLLRNGENITARCANDAAPALAYITPSDGQTLEDLRREGRAHYDRDN